MRPHRPVLALVLVIAAAASWWLARPEAAAPPPAAKAGAERTIDYYVNGLDATRMTEAGVPAHRLRTPKLRHFTDDDTSELEKPRLTVFQAEAPPWEVDSEQAWVSPDGSLILLQGDVFITREGDAENRPMHIVTSNLRVQPAQDYAETDEKVRVSSESDWVDSIGMQAWMRPPSRLKFLSQVKGHYVPR
jgi:lipopolysaccharide export system protein LptC